MSKYQGKEWVSIREKNEQVSGKRMSKYQGKEWVSIRIEWVSIREKNE